jgi:serine/threonine-protein kinase
MSNGSATPTRSSHRVGETLVGKYRLDRVIGTGGMAVVYAATHRNAKRFAVKILHPSLSMNDDVRQRFLREGYVANTVDHPGAVAIVDDHVADDGAAFLVMELLAGEPVETLAERCGGRLPVPVVVAMADQVLDVLAAAHAKGIVHRDVKPSNLFLTRDGRVKVLDFGIARLNDTTAAMTATRTGQALGTPAFMAPEQALAKSRAIDATSDLWSLGATLFNLLSGRYVHEAENAQELMVFAATRLATRVSDVAPEVPAAVAAVIDRALAFEKAERWIDAPAMRAALRAATRAALGVDPSDTLLAGFAHEMESSAPHPDEVAETARAAATPEGSGPSGAPPRVRVAHATPGAAVSPAPAPAIDSLASASRTAALSAPVTSERPARKRLAALVIGLGAFVGVGFAVAQLARAPRESTASVASASAATATPALAPPAPAPATPSANASVTAIAPAAPMGAADASAPVKPAAPARRPRPPRAAPKTPVTAPSADDFDHQ